MHYNLFCISNLFLFFLYNFNDCLGILLPYINLNQIEFTKKGGIEKMLVGLAKYKKNDPETKRAQPVRPDAPTALPFRKFAHWPFAVNC